MASAAAPRHGRAPDLPRVRPVIATPDPEPDGIVSVGSLLRREGHRAAHAVDRPLVPRARDLTGADARPSTHRAAVAAGALLAVTTVLGSNAVGDGTIISGVGVDDAADAGPAAVPPPADPLPLAAADAPVSQVMAALQSAGTPVRAVLVDGPVGTRLPGSGTVSGAGIVAAALGAPSANESTRSGTASSSGDDSRDGSRDGKDGRDTDDRDVRSAAGRSDDSSRDSNRDTDRRERADRAGRGSDDAPSRPVVPLPSVDPDLPSPVTGSDIVDGALGGSGADGSDSGSDSNTGGDSDSPPSADGDDTGGSRNTDDAEEPDAAAGEDASSDDTTSNDTTSNDKASNADAA